MDAASPVYQVVFRIVRPVSGEEFHVVAIWSARPLGNHWACEVAMTEFGSRKVIRGATARQALALARTFVKISYSGLQKTNMRGKPFRWPRA